CVRYVVVGRSRSKRSIVLPPTARLLARRVVGVAAGGVVGGVEHLDDLGDLFLDQPLDARLQRDVRRATTLAPATHLQIDGAVLDVEQLDEAAMAGDGG